VSDIYPHAPEEAQAIVATYAAEGLQEHEERSAFFADLGKLALNLQADMNDHPEVGDHYLQDVGGVESESVRGRIELLQAYGEFKPHIDKLKEEEAALEDPKQHPNYLGSGSNTAVFTIEADGKSYAVRIGSRNERFNARSVDNHMAGAIVSKDVPYFEQMVAGSYEDLVTVAEMMPGTSLGKMSIEETEAITDEQLHDLIGTFKTAKEKGIVIDPKPSNFLYDKEHGFGVVDPGSVWALDTKEGDLNLGQLVGEGGAAIMNIGLYEKSKMYITTEAFAQEARVYQVNLEVIRRYRTLVEQELTGDELTEALEWIDGRIESAEDAVRDRSNPAWVEEMIAYNKAHLDRMAGLQTKNTTAVPDGWGDADGVW
jgi:hypothetical protein